MPQSENHNRSELTKQEQIERLEEFTEDEYFGLIATDPEVSEQANVAWSGKVVNVGFDATNDHPAIRISNSDPTLCDKGDVGGITPSMTFEELLAKYGLSTISDDLFTYIVAGPITFK